MKILIATGIYIPEIGGPATYIPNLVKEFIKLGHQVKIITYSDISKFEGDDNVIRVKRSNKLSNYYRYYKALKKEVKGYDIIYAFDHFSAGIPSALISKKYKIPLYIRVGGDFIWERYLDRSKDLITLKDFYRKGIYRKEENLRFKIIKWVFKNTKGIIFTTKFQKDIFKEYYNLENNKLYNISNPINIVKKEKEESNKEIIFAGRFINKNNIINLIKAFQKLNNKDFKLILIGEGYLEKEIKTSDNIIIQSRLSREELRARIAKAYLVVFPSITDISPNTMLECLSVNTPFISSTEIGFDWIKDKIRLFNPLDINSIIKEIKRFLNKEEYNNYLEVIKKIDYNYTYNQASKDTIKIFSK